MTKARDLANIISGGFTVADLPTLTASEIPNLDASKITTGSIADARIPESAVSQHATSFDDNKIVNDISTLAIRQASNENKGAYNTNSMYVDVFQDATGYTNGANTFRNTSEFITTESTSTSTDNDFVFALNSDVNNTNPPLLLTASGNGVGTNGGDSGINSVSGTVGTYGLGFDGGSDAWFRLADNSNLHLNGDFTIDYFWYPISPSTSDRLLGKIASGALYEYYLRPHGEFYLEGRGGNLGGVYSSFTNNQWHYVAIEAHGSNLNLYLNNSRVQQDTLSSASSTERSADVYFNGAWGDGNGTSQFINGRIDGFRLTKKARYSSATTITKPTTKLNNIDTVITFNATGNFTCPTITAPSSVSKMGAIITYQDNAGTNALNTDIVLQLSADNGSNFTTATLTAMPDFASGIKMAKVNDLSVTAGTQLKYKISFANQASGSKEARIRGVSLQY
jgi:hypothetical protein